MAVTARRFYLELRLTKSALMRHNFLCVLGLPGDSADRGAEPSRLAQAASPSSRSSFWRTNDGSTTGFAR
jgi:hypothetical protein